MNKIKTPGKGTKGKKKQRTEVETKDHTRKCTHLPPKGNLAWGKALGESIAQIEDNTSPNFLWGYFRQRGSWGWGSQIFRL